MSQVGIRTIALCDKGTLLTSPTNIIVFGSRNNEELNINDVSENDVRDRPLTTKVRFETPYLESRQPQLNHLEDLFKTYRDAKGCDAEILGEVQSSGVDGGCFQFAGANYMGYRAKYEITPKKRVLAVQLGVSLEPLTAKALIDASDSNTPATLGITNLGIDTDQIRYPWPAITTATMKPASTFDPADILDYSLLLEEEGEEEQLNGRFLGDWVKATLMFKIKGLSVASMVADMVEAAGVAISMQHDTALASATYEKFVFNQYVLNKTRQRTINNKERHVIQTYTGKFPKGNMAFSYLVGVGGGTSADGTEGGTVTVSL